MGGGQEQRESARGHVRAESILHKMRSHWEFNSVLYFNWKMVDLQCASAVQQRFSHACVCSSLRLLSLWFIIG